MTDAPWAFQGCSVANGAMGSSANAGPHVLYQAPPPRNPISQPIIYGDLSSGPVTMNFGSQGGVPNLFRLPAPVHAGTVPAGATNTVPTAAARARSTPAARVDKSGIDTALRDRRLTNYEAKLKLEEPFRRFRLLWLAPALCVALNTTRWFIREQAAPVTHSILEKLPVLGHAIKSTPTGSLLARSSHLQVATTWARAFHALARGLCLATMKLWMMIVLLRVSQLSLICPHTNPI